VRQYVQEISLGWALTNDFVTMLEIDFKSNPTPQNRLVRWGLHPLIYCELTLSLVDVRLLTKGCSINSFAKLYVELFDIWFVFGNDLGKSLNLCFELLGISFELCKTIWNKK